MNDPSSTPNFAHLGPFSDFVAAARKQGPLFPSDHLDRGKARDVLRFTLQDDRPGDVDVMRTWRADGARRYPGRSGLGRERMPGY